MSRRKKLINNSNIPQHEIEAIARCIMPVNMSARLDTAGRRRWTVAAEKFDTCGGGI